MVRLWEIRSAPSTSTAPRTLARRAPISRRRLARLPRTGQAEPWSWSSAALPLQPTASDICALTCLQGKILHDLGSIAQSIEAYRHALEFASDDAERCEAWLGIAAGMRVQDQFDEAFGVLEQAESAARRLGLASALARVHYLRGSLYFPLGNIEDCFREHEQALQSAQEGGLGRARGAGLERAGRCQLHARAHQDRARLLRSLHRTRPRARVRPARGRQPPHARDHALLSERSARRDR